MIKRPMSFHERHQMNLALSNEMERYRLKLARTKLGLAVIAFASSSYLFVWMVL